MQGKNQKYTMDMVNEPILGNLIRFILPLMLSGILQLLYNAADIIVVGRWTGSTALAAVGSTGSLTNLMTNLFIGLSIGTSIVTAQLAGAGDDQGVSETTHTSMLIDAIGGILVGIIGVLFARPMLQLMDSPADVIDLSTLYLRIVFVGMPLQMIYNYGAAILKAVGDTKRPLYFLSLSGLVNVLLNLLFVIKFHMGVAGVALATVISQGISATLIVLCLMRSEGAFRLDLHRLKITPVRMKAILRMGLPAGLQGILFSVSNITIQSSVNSFGSTVMAANTASANLEGFMYTAMNSVHQGAVTFTGQNVGAKKYHRVGGICLITQATVAAIGLAMGLTATVFGSQLLGIYDTNPEVISYGLIRLRMFGFTYFLYGMVDSMVGVLRGTGNSTLPTVISLLGICGLRLVWINTALRWNHELLTLYLSYPISWVITYAALMTSYVIVKRRLLRRAAAETAG